MEWTPGGVSGDIEDRRGGGGFRMGGGIGGPHIGIGGAIVLLILGFVFHRNFLAMFTGDVSEPVEAVGPAPSGAGSQDREVQFVSFVLDDVQKTWETLLPQEGGKTYRHAKLVLYTDYTESGCGDAQSATGPFYCPDDEKVYVDLGFFRELHQRFGAPGEFAEAYVLAHEIGHHVQKVLGIEGGVRRAQLRDPSARNRLSVGLELQADCFAGVWGHSTEQRKIVDNTDVQDGMRAAASVGDDRLQRMGQGHVTPETFTHGSSAERVAAFRTRARLRKSLRLHQFALSESATNSVFPEDPSWGRIATAIQLQWATSIRLEIRAHFTKLFLQATLLSTLVITMCFAQAQTPAPEMTSRETPVTFSSRVNLVMVPVVVRDDKGRAVGTLHQDDFQLFDKGKPQMITRFSVEKPAKPFIPAIVGSALDEKGVETPADGRPPAPVAERFIAYLFDDLHLKTADLVTVRAAADRHLSESMGPGTRAAVFTTSGQIMLDFTDDRDKLREALTRIQPRANPRDITSDCIEIGFYWADAIINRSDDQASLAYVDEVMSCRGYTEQQRPLAEAEAHSSAMGAIALGEYESRLNLGVMKDVIRRLAAAPGSRNVILVSPGFYLTQHMREDEGELLDRAIRANVTLSSLDARGLYAVIPFGDITQPARVSPAAQNLVALMDKNAMMADADVLEEIAEATGGQFFHNDNGLFEGFKQLVAQPEYIYILGFSPQNLKLDGARHALKVSIKNPKGLELQARNAYYAPNHAINPEEQAKEEIHEAVFSRDEIQELPVDLSLQYARAGGVAVKLNVLAKINLKLLRFRKADDRNLNTLTVVSSVFDRNGNFVTGIQRVVEMRLRDQTLDSLTELPGSGVTVKTTLDLTPGSYLVRLVVRDSEGQTMSARNGVVEIPF